MCGVCGMCDVCICMCVCVCVYACLCDDNQAPQYKCEDCKTSWGSLFSLSTMWVPRFKLIVRLGGTYLYLLNHPTSPRPVLTQN